MMRRWAGIFLVTLALAGQAHAGDDVTGSHVSRLETEGFAVSEIRRSLLGRIVITARDDEHLREVVLEPNSGAVLRDRLFPLPEHHQVSSAEEAPPASGTSNGSGSMNQNGTGENSGENSGGGGNGGGNGNGGN